MMSGAKHHLDPHFSDCLPETDPGLPEFEPLSGSRRGVCVPARAQRRGVRTVHPMDRKLVSVADLSEYFGLGKPATRRLTKSPTFPNPVVLPKSCLRWFADEVAQWVEDQEPRGVAALPKWEPRPACPARPTPQQRAAAGPSKSRLMAERRAEKIRARMTAAQGGE